MFQNIWNKNLTCISRFHASAGLFQNFRVRRWKKEIKSSTVWVANSECTADRTVNSRITHSLKNVRLYPFQLAFCNKIKRFVCPTSKYILILLCDYLHRLQMSNDPKALIAETFCMVTFLEFYSKIASGDRSTSKSVFLYGIHFNLTTVNVIFINQCSMIMVCRIA